MKKTVVIAACIIAAASMLFACTSRTDSDPAAAAPTGSAAASESQQSADRTEAPIGTADPASDNAAGKETEAPEGTGESAENELAGKPFNNDLDMSVVIDGVKYPVREDSKKVLGVLGGDYMLEQRISCVYEGDDKTFTYDGIIVSTVPINGKDIVEMFTITGGDYTTARGIGVGASMDEVVAAYGENYWDDGYINYTESANPENISEMRIQFLFDGGKVSEIYIYSPSY